MVKVGLVGRVYIFLILLLVPFSVLNARAFECTGFLSEEVIPAHEIALSQFEFPEDAEFFIFERTLRIALHEAFEGKDFYTGLPLDYDQMSIDHVLPKALNGPNNVMNYVPTTGAINSKKGQKFGHEDLKSLEAIRDIYGPRVLALLRHYGAFENREEDLAKAVIASRRRSTYRYGRRDLNPTVNTANFDTSLPTVFRRTMDQPSLEMLEVISLFSKELSRLSDENFKDVTSKRVFQFDIEAKNAPAVDMNADRTFYLYLSYRRVGAKLVEDFLGLRAPLFELTDYNFNRRTGKVQVEIEFHPLFALKLLEAPAGRVKTIEFLQSLFRASDITKDEFMDWSE